MEIMFHEPRLDKPPFVILDGYNVEDSAGLWTRRRNE